MNTSTTLDTLTTAVQGIIESTLGKVDLGVTANNLYRAYALLGLGGEVTLGPIGRYRAHVMARRDSSIAVVIFTDYGVNHRGANSAREIMDLASIPEVANAIGQFLLSGKRG